MSRGIFSSRREDVKRRKKSERRVVVLRNPTRRGDDGVAAIFQKTEGNKGKNRIGIDGHFRARYPRAVQIGRKGAVEGGEEGSIY